MCSSKRGLPAFALPVALLGAVIAMSPAPATAQEDSLVVNFSHQHLWRGYYFGSGASADVLLRLGLLGHSRTERDLWGVRGWVGGGTPIGGRQSRKPGRHYSIGADAYACLNGLDCTSRFQVGVDEMFRPHRLAGPNRSTEIWTTVVGEKSLEVAELLLKPSLTVRRDLRAFDGWMAEPGIANVFGAGDRKTTFSVLWRLSDYRAWGAPPGDLRSHSVDLRVTFRSHHQHSGDGVLYSWTLLLEVGASFAASHVGPDVGWARFGASFVR